MLLFERYPDIKQVYFHSQSLYLIYSDARQKIYGYARFSKWYEKLEKAGFRTFNTISKTITSNYIMMLNYCDNKITKASADSFNVKFKAFRANY
jgi:transposase